jgi:bifunctional UDP-N-acetylglucosamine pyrophosphorylase/glucosamine-1-phosphate N-acetyltransferase
MAESQAGAWETTAPPGAADVAAVVLAAGKSTRMRSKTPKALHPVCGHPLLVHILNALAEAGVSRRVVVVGHQADAVRAALDERFGAGAIEYAEQTEQKGTGHAAQMAEPLLARHAGTVLVVPGDTPLLSGDILAQLIAHHRERGAAATLLTTILPTDAGAYGRVLRDERGDVAGVVEARDATPQQLEVREINTSVYAFSGPHLFRALRDLRPDNAQGELYLTDVIGLLRSAGETVAALVSPDPDVVLGVNTRVELAEVSEKMRSRLLKGLMLSGVTVIDPATTYVEAGVTVGQDTVLYPGTYLLGQTVVGEDCVIGPNAHITDARLGDRVRARACFIEQAEVGDDCKIGPFAHLRPGTCLMAKVRVGNFVETKAATLHEGVAAGHLTYLGDAEIGARTNVGAGTITCNYDGVRKHRTIVGADSFIGSHSTLVAPITVGSEAFTAAGSVITKEVPDGALAIARERQSVKEGWWAARRRRGKETTEQQP